MKARQDQKEAKKKEAEAIIKQHGGVEKVAELIQSESTQRVQNWLRRGIPSAVKLEFPHLFLNQATQQKTETIN